MCLVKLIFFSTTATFVDGRSGHIESRVLISKFRIRIERTKTPVLASVEVFLRVLISLQCICLGWIGYLLFYLSAANSDFVISCAVRCKDSLQQSHILVLRFLIMNRSRGFFPRYLYMFQYPAVFLRTVTWCWCVTFCTLFRICGIPTGLCTIDPRLSRLQPWQMNKKHSTTRQALWFFSGCIFCLNNQKWLNDVPRTLEKAAHSTQRG